MNYYMIIWPLKFILWLKNYHYQFAQEFFIFVMNTDICSSSLLLKNFELYMLRLNAQIVKISFIWNGPDAFSHKTCFFNPSRKESIQMRISSYNYLDFVINLNSLSMDFLANFAMKALVNFTTFELFLSIMTDTTYLYENKKKPAKTFSFFY